MAVGPLQVSQEASHSITNKRVRTPSRNNIALPHAPLSKVLGGAQDVQLVGPVPLHVSQVGSQA